MRRLITFACQSETLVGTLDEAPGTTGLLIVSGGNEIRSGAHRGMALLAAALAEQGIPVFRFDRRGIGDSTGDNRGFTSSGPDIMAAVAAFHAAAPHVDRLIGFGNCDAATALLLHGANALDRLILANPWVIEDNDSLPPAAAIRARYTERLRDPASWARLLSGKIDISKLVSGLLKLSKSATEPISPLEQSVFAALTARPDTAIVLATGDATAIAFVDAARRSGHGISPIMIDTESHSFARASDKIALRQAILRALA